MNKMLISILTMIVLHSSHAQEFISSQTIGSEAKSYTKILVVAKVKNETRRIQLEDALVGRLQKKDIAAVPSFLRLTKEMMAKNGNSEKALEMLVSKLNENGFDGILVTSPIDAKQSIEHSKRRYTPTTVPVRYGRFGRYYGTATIGAYEPPSVQKSQEVVFESLLYDLRGSTKENSLHWIGHVRVKDAKSLETATDKYAKMVVKRLKKEAIE